ncbi:hypothetical protein K439DRAFT_1612142 [Ramaria rubella]|nr:hypothetical protein K439DRAFT_1612142 [Ramaria rubella]
MTMRLMRLRIWQISDVRLRLWTLEAKSAKQVSAQGSIEHGVIRSYLEWLTELPWTQTTASTSQAFKLDSDHFGLEKVKRCLVEYLAIVRTKVGLTKYKGWTHEVQRLDLQNAKAGQTKCKGWTDKVQRLNRQSADEVQRLDRQSAKAGLTKYKGWTYELRRLDR